MIATKFAVAVHIMLLLTVPDPPGSARRPGGRNTSARLAMSVNTNPVVVRRITGQLVRAGLVRVQRGPGGAALAIPPRDITLELIWTAVQAHDPRPLLSLHRANAEADDAGHLHRAIETAFSSLENAFRASLRQVTLDKLAEGASRSAA